MGSLKISLAICVTNLPFEKIVVVTSEQILVYGFNLHARCLNDIRLVSTGQLNKNYVLMRQCVGCAKRHYVCMWGWIQEADYVCSFLSKT